MIPVPEELKDCEYCKYTMNLTEPCETCHEDDDKFELNPRIASYAQAAYEQGRKDEREKLKKKAG